MFHPGRNMNAAVRRSAGFLLVLLLIACGAALRGADLIPNSDCLDCHNQKDLTKTNQTGQVISLYVDEAKFAASVHRTNLCAACHSDLTIKHPDDGAAAKPVDCARCHDRQSKTYGASVHGLAVKGGDASAATCKDCHGTHEVLAPTSPASRLHFSKLTATCGECHPDAAKDVAISVHGKAAAKGDREAATCIDCHAEHQISGLKTASARKVSEEICGKCHASERINTKFRLPTDRVKTFFESYHGLAVQYGSARAANCASCHGAHKILPSTDPGSTIHRSHLVETCGKCHPGANENFATGTIHTDGVTGEDLGATLNRWVRRIYIGLIIGVIGFMVFHNLAAWLRKALAARRHQSRTVARMDASQRRQHLMLLTSFILLAITGFALKYPDSWLAWCLGSSENLRRWLHRVAGVVMLVGGTYHIYYVLAKTEGRRLVRDLWPTLQDVTDFWTHLLYLTGRSDKKPVYGRFGYPEKMEYWAVVWGTVIMGVTGLMIWFKIDVTRFMPRWIVEIATTIHYYEAILACLAIVVWHFYHVIFDPDLYPMNWAWWDGKVSEHWYHEEHGRDPLVGGEHAKPAPQSAPPGPGKDHPPGTPPPARN